MFESKVDKVELLLAQEEAVNAINEQLLKDIGIKEAFYIKNQE